jgi:hypothetical protein
MPSINEVWEQALQINSNLVIVHQDLEALRSCCADELAAMAEQTDWLAAIDTVLVDGFSSLSQSLAGIHDRQDLTNLLLRYQVLQNRTTICLLEKIARAACDQLTEADRQTSLQSAVAVDLNALREMVASVHPDAALTLSRAEEARRNLERCCPPKPAEPRCSFAPCPAPGEPEPRGEVRVAKAFARSTAQPGRKRRSGEP